MSMKPTDFPVRELRDFAEQVNSRPFRVSFFGKMKTGKSSLVNALLGTSVLPVKTITATAVRTNIRFGVAVTAEVVYLDGSQESVSMEAAKAHIVYAEGKPQVVSEVNISLPCQTLANGVVFTDTPGIDDFDELNAIAESVIDETDLAVFVCDATRFIAESERIFAAKLNDRLGGNLIFAITRFDLVDDADEIDAIANVYLRTFGNKLTGTPTIIHASVPMHGEKNVAELLHVVRELILKQEKELCRHARGTLLLRRTDEKLHSLMNERAGETEKMRNLETYRLMEYVARLNKARMRIREMVRPFDATCLEIIREEGGLLTANSMAYCLNGVANAFVNKFNANLSKLKSEFGVISESKVKKLPQVTTSDLSRWGIKAFFDQAMNDTVYREIMNVQRNKLIRAIEYVFSIEERRISKIVSDITRSVKSSDLPELDHQILACEQILDKIEREAML